MDEHEYTSSGKDMYPHLPEMKKKTERDPYREIDGVKGGCGHTTEEIIEDVAGCAAAMLVVAAGCVVVMLVVAASALGIAVFKMIFA